MVDGWNDYTFVKIPPKPFLFPPVENRGEEGIETCGREFSEVATKISSGKASKGNDM